MAEGGEAVFLVGMRGVVGTELQQPGVGAQGRERHRGNGDRQTRRKDQKGPDIDFILWDKVRLFLLLFPKGMTMEGSDLRARCRCLSLFGEFFRFI